MGDDQKRILRISIALLLPFLTCGIQWLLWSIISPYVWFLFFPTIFFSSRIGGKVAGLVSTFMSAALVVFVFIPPQLSLLGKSPANLLSVGVFLVMGALFSYTHERLEQARHRASEAQESARAANEKLLEAMITRLRAEHLQAEEELRKRNIDLEQFLYTTSHDLRTPLVTVKTFLGFLENDLITGNLKQVAQDLQFIHSAADKMKTLLDGLLELSRIDRVETPSVRFSLAELLSDVLDSMDGFISERNADIRLPGTDLVLLGDPGRLGQVWQNLIENAVKFGRHDSSPLVELGILETGAETVFFVRDNGIGIELQYDTRIFKLFEKLDPGSPGSGMGLCMVQRIVEKSGGRIWVESEGAGTGACFCFTLPDALEQG
jgi:signal transduction histidine kinase